MYRDADERGAVDSSVVIGFRYCLIVIPLAIGRILTLRGRRAICLSSRRACDWYALSTPDT